MPLKPVFSFPHQETKKRRSAAMQLSLQMLASLAEERQEKNVLKSANKTLDHFAVRFCASGGMTKRQH